MELNKDYFVFISPAWIMNVQFGLGMNWNIIICLHRSTGELM